MEGSKMFIEAGKKVSVSDLLKGIIIQSGNDASVAIAEYAGGTERGFVDLMNAYASSLNMNNTIFQNSTGLPDENHFSSAQDLAILTSNLITKFPDIYSFYKEKQFTFNDIKQLNRNKLLWRDDSSDGVKTGHTEAAGYCLVGSAKRGDMRLITVVAGSDSDNNRFLASQRLLEYGFRFFATQKVLNANQEYKKINIWGGAEKTLGLGVLEDVSLTLPRTNFKDLTVNYKYSNNIQAPIEVGQKIGTLEIISNDEIVFSTNLVALDNIKIGFKSIEGKNTTFLNGKNVEDAIRTMEVSNMVSPVAELSMVRRDLVRQQQEMGKDKSVVLDGRDIGTVVFPEAELKIFLTAEATIRAQRRFEELKAKDIDISLEEVIQNLNERDHIDSTRADSPLKQAKDAHLLDNSQLDLEASIDYVIQLIEAL